MNDKIDIKLQRYMHKTNTLYAIYIKLNLVKT